MTIRLRPLSWWIEGMLALAVLILLGYALWRLTQDGYLPQPFFFEVSDNYMDWFHTAYWAHDHGAYDNWGTLYPPLTFAMLRLLSMPKCYLDGPGLEVRDCDWVGLVVIHAIFVLNIFLVAKTYMKIDRDTALARSIALTAGMPMVFALDRGNTLLLCFTFVVLGFGTLLRSARLRWFFVACAVNFKVYLIGSVFAMLLRRRWLWVEGVLISIVVVYIVSFAIQGVGTPGEIVSNLTNFAQEWMAVDPIDIWSASSYHPLISFLSGQFPSHITIGEPIVEPALTLLLALVRAGQLAVVLAAVATWLRPEVVPVHRVAFFGLAMAMITSESGGYTLILPIFFVFMERWRGLARPFAILCCYIMCLPVDYKLNDLPTLMRESYLTQEEVFVEWGIGLTMILRPGLLILITVALSAATIRDVWHDIRHQGWRERWRFRRDHPILPGVEAPVPIAGPSGN